MQRLGTICHPLVKRDMKETSTLIREISCKSCDALLMVVPGNHREAYRIRCGRCGTTHIYQTFPVGFYTDPNEDENDDFDEDEDDDEHTPQAAPIRCRAFHKTKRRNTHRKERKSRYDNEKRSRR